MKWYQAILRTIAFLALLFVLELLDAPESVFFFAITLLAIHVAADSGSFGWGFLVLLFMPVAYPWYLIVRSTRSGTQEQKRA
jgi:hypothetical protein